MKFVDNEYLKHKDCIDVFIKVYSVVMDTGAKAIIRASWMVQGVDHNWYCSEIDRIFIKPDHYDNWLPYTPKGDRLFI